MLDELIDKRYKYYTDHMHFVDEKTNKEVTSQMNEIQKNVSPEVFKMFMELESRITSQAVIEMYNAYEIGVHDGIKLAGEILSIQSH